MLGKESKMHNSNGLKYFLFLKLYKKKIMGPYPIRINILFLSLYCDVLFLLTTLHTIILITRHKMKKKGSDTFQKLTKFKRYLFELLVFDL